MSKVDKYKIAEVEEKADIVIDEPTKKQILNHLSTGDRICYIGKDHLYRSGGFIFKISEDGSSFAVAGGNYKWTVYTKNLETLFITKK